MSRSLRLECLAFGTFVGAGAIAALALSSPIGAIGGAICGASCYLVGRPVFHICKNFLTMNKEKASFLSKIASAAASFLGASGASLGLSSLLSASATFSAVLAVTATTGGLAFIAIVVIGALCLAILINR